MEDDETARGGDGAEAGISPFFNIFEAPLTNLSVEKKV
jgi:hypothetical protein